MQGVVKSGVTGRIAFATRENPMRSGKNSAVSKMFAGDAWSRFPLALLSIWQFTRKFVLVPACLGGELELNH